ncbi:MAG TPA: proline--tRNA ligase, partial [Deltaproteobacteria bacterium]|nr:proline--tRNA ligase [Deltaproteobacteria bacterium]
SLYETLQMEGYSVLYDDRDIGAGIKFKDADLLGMPVRITVSARTLKEDSVEIKARRDEKAELVHVDEVVAFVEEFLKEERLSPSMNP